MPSSSNSGNKRGTGWVVTQFVLMGATVFSALIPIHWPATARVALLVVGLFIGVIGLAFALWAARFLGAAFTPFPRPVPAGLVTSGPFAVVRHPVYLGLLGLFGGISLVAGPPALLLTLLLGILWAGKARLEERLLAEAYPEYPAYCRAVTKRLLPYLY